MGLGTCPENCCEVDDSKCFSKRDTSDCGPDRKYDMNKDNVAHNNDTKKNCCKDWKNFVGLGRIAKMSPTSPALPVKSLFLLPGWQQQWWQCTARGELSVRWVQRYLSILHVN